MGLIQGESELGRVIIGQPAALYDWAAARLRTLATKKPGARIGLGGGSAPPKWYAWMLTHNALSPEQAAALQWHAADERYVPLDHEDSNFGLAERDLLNALDVPADNRFPWPTQVDPHSAPIVFERDWIARYGITGLAFDLAFLGMGPDGHTLSIFPGSPLLTGAISNDFAAVDVPAKGWRLTLTPTGLAKCHEIVLLATGSSKAAMVADVMQAPYNRYPVQILREHREKTIWLLDEDAAAAWQSSSAKR